MRVPAAKRRELALYLDAVGMYADAYQVRRNDLRGRLRRGYFRARAVLVRPSREYRLAVEQFASMSGGAR